jgi:hypothetical protein
VAGRPGKVAVSRPAARNGLVYFFVPAGNVDHLYAVEA